MKLGRVNDFRRWFSLIRSSSPWIAPRQGDAPFKVNDDALLVSYLLPNGTSLVFMALTTPTLSAFIRSDSEGAMWLVGKNDDSQQITVSVFVALGASVHNAVATLCTTVLHTLRHEESSTSNSFQESFKSRKTESIDLWLDGLTWCTWNALGQELQEKGLLEAVDVLAKSGIRVSNLLIDDGWQTLDGPNDDQFRRGWCAFEADVDHFPSGLGATITKIRHDYGHIKHIGLWHGIFGYWGGISSVGPIAHKYESKTVPKHPYLTDTKEYFVVSEVDVHRLYDDFYSFLSNAGIDAVKVDNQNFVDLLSNPSDRRKLISAYQSAWMSAALRHFLTEDPLGQEQFRVISCMSLAPVLIFNVQLNPPTTLDKPPPRYLLRNSDDFFPDDPGSQTWHIFSNAHNAVLTDNLPVIPDWDMFQTGHEYGRFHAAARCISGGPICITDVPGDHDFDLIKEMTATTTNGVPLVLRPGYSGRALDVYRSFDQQLFCNVGAGHPYLIQRDTADEANAIVTTSIVGVFNMADHYHAEFISLTHFLHEHTKHTSAQYVVRSHRHDKMWTRKDREFALFVELEDKGYDIITAFPIQRLTLPGYSPYASELVVLGLRGKLTGAAAIQGVMVSGHVLEIGLKALGVLEVWSSLFEGPNAADMSYTDPVAVDNVEIPRRWTTRADSGLLSVNLESAWAQMNGLSRESESAPRTLSVQISLPIRVGNGAKSNAKVDL